MLKVVLTALVGVSTLCAAARADTYTETKAISGNFYGGNIDGIILNGFDTSRGFLNGISTTLNIQSASHLIYFTNGPAAKVEPVTTKFSFLLVGAGGYNTKTLLGSAFVTPTGQTDVTDVFVSTVFDFSVPDDKLVNFEDGGSIDFINVAGYSYLTNRGLAQERSTYNLTVTATVAFDYTPAPILPPLEVSVPEPASLGLLLAGLVVANVRRPRRI